MGVIESFVLSPAGFGNILTVWSLGAVWRILMRESHCTCSSAWPRWTSAAVLLPSA